MVTKVMTDEDLGKKEEINLNYRKQLAKSKWQRECREREKNYPVFYDSTRYLKRDERICEFCTRTVYFDSHHLNADGTWFPHDRYYPEGVEGKEVHHHVTHCIGIYGTKEQKEECRKLREAKGMPDPFYSTNPERLFAKKKKEIETLEKNIQDKKIVPPERIATLDEAFKEKEEKKDTIVVGGKEYDFNKIKEQIEAREDGYENNEDGSEKEQDGYEKEQDAIVEVQVPASTVDISELEEEDVKQDLGIKRDNIINLHDLEQDAVNALQKQAAIERMGLIEKASYIMGWFHSRVYYGALNNAK